MPDSLTDTEDREVRLGFELKAQCVAFPCLETAILGVNITESPIVVWSKWSQVVKSAYICLWVCKIVCLPLFAAWHLCAPWSKEGLALTSCFLLMKMRRAPRPGPKSTSWCVDIEDTAYISLGNALCCTLFSGQVVRRLSCQRRRFALLFAQRQWWLDQGKGFAKCATFCHAIYIHHLFDRTLHIHRLRWMGQCKLSKVGKQE